MATRASKVTKGSKAAKKSTKESGQEPVPGPDRWTPVCHDFKVHIP